MTYWERETDFRIRFVEGSEEWDFSYERDGSERYFNGNGEYLISLNEWFCDDYDDDYDDLSDDERDEYDAVSKELSDWTAEMHRYSPDGRSLERVEIADSDSPMRAFERLQIVLTQSPEQDVSEALAFFDRAMELWHADKELSDNAGKR